MKIVLLVEKNNKVNVKNVHINDKEVRLFTAI